MIERVVLIELTDEHRSPQGLQAVVRESQRVLRGLPGVLEVRVGLAADGPTAEDWDVMLVLRFAELADVEPYRVHPDHRAYVDTFLKPRLAGIRAWNFELDAA